MLVRDLPLDTGLPEPVVLRRLTVADADAFAAHVAADQARLSEHLAWPWVTHTPQGAAAWLGRYERGEDGRVLLGGAWRGDELLGGALLMHHDADSGNVEVGCWLVAAGEGHGVAAAACRAVIAIGRRELGVARVEWRVAPDNVRSRRLAERLGFVHEGTLRANYVVDGRRLDTDVLSLVGDEIDAAIADTTT